MTMEKSPSLQSSQKFEALRKRFTELFESGATYEFIAKELGIAIPTVSLWRDRLGLAPRRDSRSSKAWWDERRLGDKSVMQMLSSLAGPLSLNQGDIRSIVGLFTRQMIDGWEIQGRPLQDIMLATVFIYIRAWRPPISASQFSSTCSNAGYYVNQKRILRICKELREARVKIDPPKPQEILWKRKYALKKELGIDDQIINDACSLIAKARNQGLTHGKSPFSLAASAVYLTAQNRTERYITEGDLSRFFAVTEVTIRNTNKILSRFVAGTKSHDSNLGER